MGWRSGDWSRGDKIGAIGLVIAIVGVLAAVLAIPGAPRVLPPDESPPTQPSKPEDNITAARIELEKLEHEVPLRSSRIEEDEGYLANAKASLDRAINDSKNPATKSNAELAKLEADVAQRSIAKLTPDIDRERTGLQAVEDRIAVLRARIAQAP